ncbi:LuxR C-terminal-related transcriptional regulator [Pseudomonas putida]|uniref:response regulator transcription factor n=1 Tax=Pseudomonas putida TaxID=303 RepID=UPI003D99A476
MISAQTLRELRYLVLRDGASVRAASRQLCISRNTAKRWLSVPEWIEPRYPLRIATTGLLDAYKDHLVLWLKAGIQGGEHDRRSIGSCFECLRAMGFPGSKSLVYNYCRSWKLQHHNASQLVENVALAWSGKGLTTREREVLAWVGRGRSCREIATLMGIAPLTVRKHRCNILGKVGLHSTAQLVAFAISGLLRPSGRQNLPALSRLSARERQVVALLAKGLTSKEIARCLDISPATVRKHRENAMKSIRAHGMASLIWHSYGLDAT